MVLVLESLEMREFLGARNTPGCPKIEKDYAFRIIAAERLRMTGEVLEREINGLLSLRPERQKKVRTSDEPNKPGD